MSWNKAHIDDVARRSAPADYALFEAVGLSELDGARVLDAGCFDGFNTALKFGPYRNLAEIVGLDPDAHAIERARAEHADERFTWGQGGIESFDAADETFDLVYFSHSFQHVRSKERTLENVFRLLKPGGFVAIKTVDDSCNQSFPDPQNLMRRTYRLYEEQVLPHTEHTRWTDRNNGQKCYGYLHGAGFGNIRVRTQRTDTADRTRRERLDLFERGTYFRSKVPQTAAEGVALEMGELLESWRQLFEDGGYYYATETFLVLAQKPDPGAEPARYCGPLFSSAASAAPSAPDELHDGFRLSPMTEDDLGDVMRIELVSFPSPWTPLAYALELRHNAASQYRTARDAQGRLCGYLGWWHADGYATIAHVAVDPQLRRAGIGRLLLDDACKGAQELGCHTMQLQVRAANSGARAFYRTLGFEEVGLSTNYYTDPDDDAVIMIRPLSADEDKNRK